MASQARPLAPRVPHRPTWLSDALLLEAAFVVAVAVAALLLRVWGLGSLPDGLHGDEAATGLDARRILAGHDLFPYTPSALGQPSGPMYWAAVWVHLLGSTVVAVRLPMALLGVGTVLLGYAAFRLLYGQAVAVAGAVLLAFSSWQVFYNRTGFTASAMPFTEMAALLAVAVALRRDGVGWWIAAGAVVGAGVYGYFSYPLFAAALALWLVVHFAMERVTAHGPRVAALWPHVRNGAVMALTALLIVQPMWPYVTGSQQGYTHDRKTFALSNTPAYQRADTLGRVRLYWDNAKRVVNALREGGHADASDGSGEVSAVDPLLAVLALAGAGLCVVLAVRRRRAAYLLPLIVVPVVMIGPLWSAGGVHRRSLGALPFIVLPAAVLLGEAWAWLHGQGMRTVAALALAVPLVLFAGLNIDRYFRQTPDTPVMLFTFAPELTDAALLMRAQAPDVHIYFAAGRWSAGYETVQYLVPGRRLGGGTLEDRSSGFGSVKGYAGVDRTHPALIVLLNNYVADADKVAALYPDATRLIGRTIAGQAAFVAFSVPPRAQ